MKYTPDVIAAPFKTPPFLHQIKEYEGHFGSAIRAKGWTMRTGKSKSVIDKACFLHTVGGERGKIDGVLVFAPNGVHANWVVRELPAHMWDGVPYTSLVWHSTRMGTIAAVKQDRGNWTDDQVAFWQALKDMRVEGRLVWFTVNTESMTRKDVRKAVARFFKTRKRVFVVFDESDDFGTPGAIRTKMGRSMRNHAAYVEILSGTIITGSPLAAFSQFDLLKKGALGFNTFAEFKRHFAIEEERSARGRTFSKVVGFQNEDELRDRMAQYMSVVTREDVAGMPDLVQEPDIDIEPTKEQLRIYRELHKSFRIAIRDEEISVGERAVRLQKMQQVFSGFVKDESGETIIIPGRNPRVEALSREVFLTPGKVIVWCQYQQDFVFLRKRLLADRVKFVEYHGRVPERMKAKSLRLFREKRDFQVFLGHPQSCGRGIDLSAAQRIINYSHTFSARLIAQALERATKIGAKNIQLVDFMAPGPDFYIRSVTRARKEIADAIAGVGMRDLLERLAL